MNKINKEVLMNAVVAGVLMSGAVILKAALGNTITVNMDMNDISNKALQGELIEAMTAEQYLYR